MTSQIKFFKPFFLSKRKFLRKIHHNKKNKEKLSAMMMLTIIARVQQGSRLEPIALSSEPIR
jgi:hypothetical protein